MDPGQRLDAVGRGIDDVAQPRLPDGGQDEVGPFRALVGRAQGSVDQLAAGVVEAVAVAVDGLHRTGCSG